MPRIPRRYLEALVRLLVVAVLAVFLLVLIAAFLQIVQPRTRNGNGTAAPTTAPPTTAAGTTTSTTETATTVPASTTTTTTIPVAGNCLVERPQAAEGTTVLTLHFHCGGGSVPSPPDTPVYRIVPATQLVLSGSLTELVKGPTAEERDRGFVSPFSNLTISSFRNVSLSAGRAIVDFVSIDFAGSVAGAGGAEFLLASLNATVFQFDTITEVEYRLGGDCDAFWSGAGEDGCRVITRAEWTNQVAQWRSQR